MSGERPAINAEGTAYQLPDIDPEETKEWLDSLDALLDADGPNRTRFIMLKLMDRARQRQVGLPSLRSTDYINTIPPEDEPRFPGDEDLERKIRRSIRWNAAIMVSKANRKGLEVGGHIATYQSAASLYEVGYNHFFRGRDHPGGGDQIYVQGHAAPGIYARSFLLGRLSADQLDGFRQEHSRGPGRGLSSYPHPRSMPDFWEFPTVSMGIGPLNAIYQARFNRYLEHRGIKDTSQQHVWAFLGDGEMGEPESLGAIGVAAREGLDNLTFVINCNLQQLDGPVRGNGKVIQELESFFRGAGWHVIKVLWGRDWDPLLAQDTDGALVHKMNSTPDGQFQTYTAESGAYIRDHFFGDPRLSKMVADMSDLDLERLSRGGHDYRKVYAAFQSAFSHHGQPTVILAQTVKGWTIESFEAKNATHQMKKLTSKDLKAFRDRIKIPIPDADLEDANNPPYYHPGEDSEVIRYMHHRRRQLGGFAPRRIVKPRQLELPKDKLYKPLLVKPGTDEKVPSVATTQAFVRLLRDLMRDKDWGERIVPIAPDEYRTFGMDSMFPTNKIYNPAGQTYESVDRKLLLSWKEARKGQLLHEGISEAGGLGSFTAAGTSYATHGEPMIPVFLFYSMFGFQRVGDFIWAAADQLTRGFLIGATAGRTTLTGEGLQHADGHSPLLAASNPAVVHYDPAFGFEIAHIVKDGLRRMYGYGLDDQHPNGEDIFYYLTVYNEPVPQPGPPDDLDIDGLLKGMYLFSPALGNKQHAQAQILASGVAVPWALKAQQMLRDEWSVDAAVWSVTSWNELAREAIGVEERNFRHPMEPNKTPYVTEKLADADGPVIAVSDYQRAVPDQIRPYVHHEWRSLGTDGFGFSDTRAAARRFFMVDAESIVVATLDALARNGKYRAEAPAEAFRRYKVDDPQAVGHVKQEGAGA
ncbi:pyruvate dehydrogenase (acetyl-transferring), homodimeric type [Granulicoccus sp. GXG6511]|uniref:pyruvate dehydrogenase (acetyl-transferring), homodimeric type n=1 Tax=Granulicoccus sp. GXG6511 TaxID=3381351 RepID=UPI003D7DF82F